MRIAKVPIKKINPATYNPRKDLTPDDPEYQKLERSIQEFGYVEPLVWNRQTGNLVGGHQRLKVLKAQGHKHVEVSVVDLNPTQERALNLALNKISGDWDEQKLAQLLDELTRVPDFDIGVTGFDLPEARAIITETLASGEGAEDFDLSTPIDRSRPAITRIGEVLELGPHRLSCRDCTDPSAVRELMKGERAVLFATDPPYLVNYDGLNHPGRKNQQRRKKNKDWSAAYGVLWDEAGANPDLFDKFIRVALDEAIADNAAWYHWHASRRQVLLESVWEKHGALPHQQIIWVKDRGILTRSWYSWQHEPCFFGWLKGHKPPRRSDEHLPSVWMVPTTAPGQVTDHPTIKPLELFLIPMKQHTRGDEVCYEPFAGSGTQIVAAQKLGRRCFALEIDPYFCDVAVRRYIACVGEANVPAKLRKRYGTAAPAQKGRAA